MKLSRRRFVSSCAAAAAAATHARVGAQVAAGIDVVQAFGFIPDGRTDNYEAFHRWAAHVNRSRGGSYIFPAGRYFVKRYRGQPTPQGAGHLATRNSGISRVDGLTLSGYGAQIILNGAFHRSARIGPHGTPLGFDMAPFLPFELDRCRNVRIAGFKIDGGVSETSRDPSVNETYAGLITLVGCSDVLLEDLELYHGQTDGVYITSTYALGTAGLACRNIRLARVTSRDNARGGLGIIQVLGLTCIDCKFNGNGQRIGKYEPHAPGFGADIEPDYVDAADVDVLTGNIEFRNCEFRNNISALLAGYRDRYQGYLRVIDCRSSNERGGPHHIIISWAGALIERGVHDGGDGTIWLSWQDQSGGDVSLHNVEIRTSATYGLFHPHDGNVVRLEGLRIVGTHRSAPNHGYILAVHGDPGRGSQNLVRGCRIHVPATRKSPGHPYDYEVSFRHTVSEQNAFTTDLPAIGGNHFCTEYGRRAVARGDVYRGTAPGPNDSFRPAHNSNHDTRLPYFSPGQLGSAGGALSPPGREEMARG